MCGIAGIFHPSVPKPVDPARVRAMSDALAHRGPDGSGVWTAPGIGFGHRRLTTLDAESGAQPMLDAVGRVAVVSDGKVYNFRELRAELEARGHGFRSESDTEVILAAWNQWGPDCLQRFNGMFAFALYDATADALLLARDRFGVKPLFYAELADGALIFASELKGLLAHPLFRRAPSPQAVDDYLAFGYVPDDASILAGVNKLAAGHYLLIRRGRPVPAQVRWWDIDFTSDQSGTADELIELMRQAVRSCMISDVPIGALLSGGLESSAVLAFMAEASRSAVNTCSIALEEPEESRHAELVARRFASSHRSRTIPADDFGIVQTIVDAFDEPFGQLCAPGTYRLAQLARENMKVGLSGEGADEAFAGHERYRRLLLEERARRLFLKPVRNAANALGELHPKLARATRWHAARASSQRFRRNSEEAYADVVCATDAALRSKLYRPEFISALQGHRPQDRYIRVMREAPAADPLSRAQYADLKIRLPGDMLTRMDRTSMAVGLELREPLLDHRLVQFAAHLPSSLRIRGRSGKWLLKQALQRHLPREVLQRRDVNPVAPVGQWFSGVLAPAADAMARDSALAELGWFDESAISRIIADHRSQKVDRGSLLWRLLMLDMSLQKLFGLRRSSSYTASAK